MTSGRHILLVEDDPNDVELTLSAFDEYELQTKVSVVNDGQEALDFLRREGAWAERDPGNPSVILLDIKLPRLNGLQVLKEVRSDDRLQMIPIVMLTSSREEKDLAASYSRGANAYVVKPVQFDSFMNAMQGLSNFWAAINQPPPMLQN